MSALKALLLLCRWTSDVTAVTVQVPFAQAAQFAAELPEVRACDGGLGPECDGFRGMTGWRYAVNNLRRAVDLLPQETRSMHKSTISFVAQISAEVEDFFQQPSAESLMVAVQNARQVFEALKGWMITSPPSVIEVDVHAGIGVPFLNGGRSMRILNDKEAQAAEAEVRLANGVEMPVLGFGTGRLIGQECYDATLQALRVGYRHIDTAQAYGNEAAIGQAIVDSGVPRRALFLVTKLSDPADFQPDALLQRFTRQLKDLQTDYLDLYMLHSPGAEATKAAWQKMEEFYRAGMVKALGVSNFGIKDLQDLLSFAMIPPVYLQNKFSIYNPGEQSVNEKESIMSYLNAHGITMMGYSVINPWPFVIPPMRDPHVLALASRLGKSPSQVLHRWVLQLGGGVMPRSGNATHIEENSKIFDFSLSELDMRLLSGLVTLSESTVSSVKPSWVEDVYGLGVGVQGVS